MDDIDQLFEDADYGLGSGALNTLEMTADGLKGGYADEKSDIIVFGNDGKIVRARTKNQKKLVEEYYKNDLIFALGPAGTGKTYTAIALAVRALKNREVKKLILTRPAVEAGEKLGFLPGDLQNKVDPYLRPLNDALGGVEVTIHAGDILPARFVPGTTVLLKGDDVQAYVQARRTELPDEPIDSNNNRMARQRQYMMKFIRKALEKTKEDMSVPVNLFSIAMKDDNMVTNLNASKVAYLTTIVTKMNFTEESFWTIPGEVKGGVEYAEYHVDDEALYQMILDTFYVKE